MWAAQVPTPLGAVLLAATGEGLAGLWFEGQRHHPDPSAWTVVDLKQPGAVSGAANPNALRWLQQAAQELQHYFEGDTLAKGHRFTAPLSPAWGSAFQRQVWAQLAAIAPGCSISYGALARQLGRPSAVRAVAAAVGRNPLSIIVPCHRVLGAKGSLTGYAGGLERKRALLRREGLQSA